MQDEEELRRALSHNQGLLFPLRAGSAPPHGDGSTLLSLRMGIVQAKVENLEAALQALDLEQEAEEGQEEEGDKREARANAEALLVLNPEAAALELEQAQALQREQLRHTQEELKREQMMLAEAKAIEETIRCHLDEFSEEPISIAKREETMSKLMELREANAALEKGLLQFVDRAYPPSFNTDGYGYQKIKKARRKQQGDENIDTPPPASLRDTLIELFDARRRRLSHDRGEGVATVDSSDNGWVPMLSSERTLWPPYVDLLEQANIVRRTTTNIQLRHFHDSLRTE